MILRLLPLSLLAFSGAVQEWNAPPPPIAAPHAAAPSLSLVELAPGEARCEGGPVAFARYEPPLPVAAFGTGANQLQPVTISFRIDAQGRPLGIARMNPSPDALSPSRLFYSDDDLVPAFATARFAPGERRNCTVRFEARKWSIADAPPPVVARYLVAPHPRQGGQQALFRRIHPADTDCMGAGSPKLRLRAYPAFEDIAIAPGAWAYAMTAFDINAKGRPVNVRIVASDGNAALDRASIKAVRQTRYAHEARHGCTYPYYRRSEATIAAPPPPEKSSMQPADARCPEADTKWTSMPRLQFPAGFVQRRIEGWAIIAYDVAPWGEIGNVRVLRAEPADAFGYQARDIVRNARQGSSPTGRSGCVDLVRFVMPNKGQEPAATDS
ncbi:TonB family protein [Sphingomonas sp. HT-1]|uniref:TonB family protein n=1 Tax=unclassified Sphingomonas TaxID=196159 RepID=UPI00031EA451|nr:MULTISPECIES: TonB family protein [unclassified Sphingomonas]KTF70598.1 hypothetical protein ATB93_03575 [Sphingomonas sp. WG]